MCTGNPLPVPRGAECSAVPPLLCSSNLCKGTFWAGVSIAHHPSRLCTKFPGRRDCPSFSTDWGETEEDVQWNGKSCSWRGGVLWNAGSVSWLWQALRHPEHTSDCRTRKPSADEFLYTFDGGKITDIGLPLNCPNCKRSSTLARAFPPCTGMRETGTDLWGLWAALLAPLDKKGHRQEKASKFRGNTGLVRPKAASDLSAASLSASLM